MEEKKKGIKMNYIEDSGEPTIKSCRLSAGLTQKEFSKMFGIPIDVIKSWDCGRRTPPDWVKRLVIEKLQSIEKKKEL